MKKYIVLLTGILSIGAYAQLPDVAPQIDGMFSRVEALKIRKAKSANEGLNLINGSSCFVETRDNKNKLDQRINFSAQDIDKNGKLILESSSRSVEVDFKNNSKGGLNLKITSGRKKDRRSSVDMSVQSLSGLELRLYGGHHGNQISGYRKVHFICH